MRCPETNSARSHQCEPMSANARDAPPSCLVDAPVVVARAQQPVLEVAAVDQADRAGDAGADALARLAHRGVVAVDERHGGRRARRPPAASTISSAPRSSIASGFSQMTCLPAASAASASGRCRWLGVQMCTTSTSGASTSSSAVSNERSAPSAAAASRPRSGEDAATPTRRAPARRADRAWTAPMNPVPAMATRTSPPDMSADAIEPLAQMSSKRLTNSGGSHD